MFQQGECPASNFEPVRSSFSKLRNVVGARRVRQTGACRVHSSSCRPRKSHATATPRGRIESPAVGHCDDGDKLDPRQLRTRTSPREADSRSGRLLRLRKRRTTIAIAHRSCGSLPLLAHIIAPPAARRLPRAQSVGMHGKRSARRVRVERGDVCRQRPDTSGTARVMLERPIAPKEGPSGDVRNCPPATLRNAPPSKGRGVWMEENC